jgi:hypothetical protein
MYNPINSTGANAFMRWPLIGLPVAAAIGLFSNSLIGAAVAWVASVALATWATHKVFKKQLCNCEGEAKRKGWLGDLPKVKWVVEHSPESGGEKPWELFSMFGDDESTKQHYASYTTEERALKRKEFFEAATRNPTKD